MGERDPGADELASLGRTGPSLVGASRLLSQKAASSAPAVEWEGGSWELGVGVGLGFSTGDI